MTLSPSCQVSSLTPVVCQLKKAFYGLKQSPHSWFGRFTVSMKSFGYQQSNDDYTIFYHHSLSRGVTLLLVLWMTSSSLVVILMKLHLLFIVWPWNLKSNI